MKAADHPVDWWWIFSKETFLLLRHRLSGQLSRGCSEPSEDVIHLIWIQQYVVQDVGRQLFAQLSE